MSEIAGRQIVVTGDINTRMFCGVLPPVMHFVLSMRLLPTGVCDRVATSLGINASMDVLKGRGN